MPILFRLDPIDLIRERITASTYILVCGLDLREGRVMAVHDGRVGETSRNEAESASNAIGFPTLGVDVMSC